MWLRAVWEEGDQQEEGVVPASWVIDKTLYWPPGVNAEKAIRAKKEPTDKWRKFPIVKIKLQSEDRDECEEYDLTTTQECDDDTDEERNQRKRKKKKTFDDFVTEQEQRTIQDLQKELQPSTSKDITKESHKEKEGTHRPLPVPPKKLSSQQDYARTKSNSPTPSEGSTTSLESTSILQSNTNGTRDAAAESMLMSRSSSTARSRSTSRSRQNASARSRSRSRSNITRSRSTSRSRQNTTARSRSASRSRQNTTGRSRSTSRSRQDANARSNSQSSVMGFGSAKQKQSLKNVFARALSRSKSSSGTLAKSGQSRSLDMQVGTETQRYSLLEEFSQSRSESSQEAIGRNHSRSSDKRKESSRSSDMSKRRTDRDQNIRRRSRSIDSFGLSRRLDDSYENRRSRSRSRERSSRRSRSRSYDSRRQSQDVPMSSKKTEAYPMSEANIRRELLDRKNNSAYFDDGHLEEVTQAKTMDDLSIMEEDMKKLELRHKLVKKLTTIGGLSYKDNTKKIMEKLMSNELMSKMNMKGNKGKVAFANTGICSIVRTSVMNTFKVSEHDVNVMIGTVLKYAPDRQGGGGRKSDVHVLLDDVNDS